MTHLVGPKSPIDSRQPSNEEESVSNKARLSLHESNVLEWAATEVLAGAMPLPPQRRSSQASSPPSTLLPPRSPFERDTLYKPMLSNRKFTGTDYARWTQTWRTTTQHEYMLCKQERSRLLLCDAVFQKTRPSRPIRVLLGTTIHNGVGDIEFMRQMLIAVRSNPNIHPISVLTISNDNKTSEPLIRATMQALNLDLTTLCCTSHEIQKRAENADLLLEVSTGLKIQTTEDMPCAAISDQDQWAMLELNACRYYDSQACDNARDIRKMIHGFGFHPYSLGCIVNDRLLAYARLSLSERRQLLHNLSDPALRSAVLSDGHEYNRVLLQGYPQEMGGEISRSEAFHAWLSIGFMRMHCQKDQRNCDVFASVSPVDIRASIKALPILITLGFSQVVIFNQDGTSKRIVLSVEPGRTLRIFTHRHSEDDLQILRANSDLPLASGDNTIMAALCSGQLPFFQLHQTKHPLLLDLMESLHDPDLDQSITPVGRQKLWKYFASMHLVFSPVTPTQILTQEGAPEADHHSESHDGDDEAGTKAGEYSHWKSIHALAKLSIDADVTQAYAILRQHIIGTYGLHLDSPGPMANWIHRSLIYLISPPEIQTLFDNAVLGQTSNGERDQDASLRELEMGLPAVLHPTIDGKIDVNV